MVLFEDGMSGASAEFVYSNKCILNCQTRVIKRLKDWESLVDSSSMVSDVLSKAPLSRIPKESEQGGERRRDVNFPPLGETNLYPVTSYYRPSLSIARTLPSSGFPPFPDIAPALDRPHHATSPACLPTQPSASG